MKKNIKYHRSAITISAIFLIVFLLVRCVDHEELKEQQNKITYAQFAGSATCANCHKDIYDKHIHTAHFLSTRPADTEYIKGSFDEGKNVYTFNNSVSVVMEKRIDGFYQVEYFNGAERKAKRIDIVVGSGTMGQSFLNWGNDHLFQLPITFFTAANEWSNSPGYPDKVVFNRVITSRCLECHTTFAQVTSPAEKEPETFDQRRLILGVDCEKCHGPAAQHVQFYQQHPKDNLGKYIINPAKLSRQQQLDLCALCHGGHLEKTKPSFSFEPGDTLANYFNIDTTTPNPNSIDVHGNQYGLLRASKCFKMSTTLTCSSCHNTHEKERGNTVLFSQRCMNCHNNENHNFCTFKQLSPTVLKNNCIDCHMPLNPSRAIAVYLPGSSTPTSALIRSHFITIYPEETKKFMALRKDQKANK